VSAFDWWIVGWMTGHVSAALIRAALDWWDGK